MANKKPKAKLQRASAKQIPLGRLQRGLKEHTDLRRTQREMLAHFDPVSSAFDEVLEQLTVLSKIDGLDSQLVYLLEEAQKWVIDGVDQLLSAPIPHEAEEARKLLELEHLLWDFAATPANVNEWSESEAWNRQSKFGFGELRKREEKRQGLDELTVIAARDYWITHSINAHPRPQDSKKPSGRDSSRSLLSSLGDLFQHAVSVVRSAQAVVVSRGLVIPDEYAALSTVAIDKSWERMHRVLHSHIPEDKFQSLREPRAKKG